MRRMCIILTFRFGCVCVLKSFLLCSFFRWCLLLFASFIFRFCYCLFYAIHLGQKKKWREWKIESQARLKLIIFRASSFIKLRSDEDEEKKEEKKNLTSIGMYFFLYFSFAVLAAGRVSEWDETTDLIQWWLFRQVAVRLKLQSLELLVQYPEMVNDVHHKDDMWLSPPD